MQKQKGVTVGNIVLLILLALACAVLAWRNEDWNEGVRILFMLGAVVFLAIAIVACVQWIGQNDAYIYEIRVRAENHSERVQFAEAVGKLSPEQLAGLGKYVPAIEVISGTQGPIYLWRCMGGGLITRSFIRRYINMGDEVSLCPVRELSHEDQDQAMDFIRDAAQRGWVTLPAGNQPAKWVNRVEALQQIFGGEA